MLNQQQIDLYILTHCKYFPEEKILFLKEKLKNIDEDKFNLLSALELKDPTIILIISIFLGGLGIDRFMIGSNALGILKLLTGGGCSILWIIDIFLIGNKTKEVNYKKVISLL